MPPVIHVATHICTQIDGCYCAFVPPQGQGQHYGQHSPTFLHRDESSITKWGYESANRCTYMYIYIYIHTHMNLNDFNAVLLVVTPWQRLGLNTDRCTTTGPLPQQLGVLLVILQSERAILNFQMRNIWTNDHILSEQFTQFLVQNHIFKISLSYLLPLAAPTLTCGVTLDLDRYAYNSRP